MKDYKDETLNIVCADLLALPAFRTCRLLTKRAVVCHGVRWVHFITPSMELDFLQGGEFLILKCLSLRDQGLIAHLIRCLHRRCSGLLLIYGAALPEDEAMEQLTDTAEKLNIPLFAASEPVSVSELCRTVGTLIFKQQFKKDLEVSIIHQLLENGPLEQEELLDMLKSIGFDDRQLYAAMVIRPETEAPPTQLLQNVRQSLCASLRQGGWTFFCGCILGDKLYFIVPEQSAGCLLRDQMEKAIAEYRKLDPDTVLHCGIGPRWNKVKDARYSMEVALKLVRLPHRHCVRDIQKQIIFRILCQFENEQELFNIYSNVFRPLLEYDQAHNTNLLQCLKAYLENNMNFQQSSKVLYLHVNTMRNRILLIEKLLGCELRTDRWNTFRYYLGFFLEDYLYANTSLLQNVTPGCADKVRLPEPAHDSASN